MLKHHSQTDELAFKQRLRFGYNELGQLIRQQVDEHQPIEFGFDEIGRLSSLKQSEALTTSYEYTKAGQLKRQSVHRAGQLIARETDERSDRLEWDENECLSSFYDTGERQTRYQYRYDALR